MMGWTLEHWKRDESQQNEIRVEPTSKQPTLRVSIKQKNDIRKYMECYWLPGCYWQAQKGTVILLVRTLWGGSLWVTSDRNAGSFHLAKHADAPEVGK